MPKKDDKTVIEKLFALSAELEAEIQSNPSDVVRTPLLNIRGSLSHLRDAIATDKAMER